MGKSASELSLDGDGPDGLWGGDRTPAWEHDDREHRGPPCSKELRAGGCLQFDAVALSFRAVSILGL